MSTAIPTPGTVLQESPATSNWSEDPLTARARTIWSAADFHPIARSFAEGAVEFVDRLELRQDETVLDVACGTGNLAIPAAWHGALVTGVDIAANLIAQARIEAGGLDRPITFDVGDAESLPYRDGQFETTITMFGAMFAYRPERAAAEMLRVTRHGGRIAMANWTPGSLIARMLGEHVKVAPPPAGVSSVLEWGKPDVVRERFGDRVRDLTCTARPIALRLAFPPEAVTELFAQSYGPTVTALARATPEAASALRAALTALFVEANVATDGTTVLMGEYLDVQARVR